MADAIDVKEKCSQCIHHATCKFSGEYEKFNETLKDELHKWGSEFEFIPTLEVSCRYFLKIQTRPDFLRQVEGAFVEEKSPCATCSQSPIWCTGCEKERKWRADELKKQVDSEIEKDLSKRYTKEDADVVKTFGVNHL